MRRADTASPYSDLDLRASNYDTPCESLRRGALATLSPVKYLQCKEALDTSLIPLFLVRKRHEATAYYNAFFVVDRRSNIATIGDTAIHTLLLVDSNSASGFIAPLMELYNAKVIDAPTLGAVGRRKPHGWSVRFVHDRRDMIAQINSDVATLGAVGGFPNQDDPDNAPVRVILRYESLPQDVLVVSSDLQPFEPVIRQWFTDILATDGDGRPRDARAEIFEKSSSALTGVVLFSAEHKNALARLATMRDQVLGRSALPHEPFSFDMTLKETIKWVTNASLTTLCVVSAAAFTIAMFFIALGHFYGAKILSFVAKVKKLWEHSPDVEATSG